MKKQSAGLLVYRKNAGQVEVLIVHPGGPFWAKKDKGVWSTIKGEHEEREDAFTAAKREFKEETSQDPPQGNYFGLGETKLKSGKIIKAWAVEGDFDPSTFESNTFEMEWPPKSGQKQNFPEVDRAEWFTLQEASKKIHPEQVAFLQRLAAKLNIEKPEPEEPKQSTLF